MQRDKMRKAVAALPFGMPEPALDRAMLLVKNEATRTRLRARYLRAERARAI